MWRTLGHQGPNLGLGWKLDTALVQNCDDRWGCRSWSRRRNQGRALDPQLSPTTREKLSSELLRCLVLTQTTRAPFTLNEPELEKNREGDQEAGPGFLSACYMWDERGRGRVGTWKLIAIDKWDSWLRHLTAHLMSPLGFLRNIQVHHGHETSDLQHFHPSTWPSLCPPHFTNWHRHPCMLEQNPSNGGLNIRCDRGDGGNRVDLGCVLVT